MFALALAVQARWRCGTPAEGPIVLSKARPEPLEPPQHGGVVACVSAWPRALDHAARARFGALDRQVMHTHSRKAEKVDKLLLYRYQSAN
jgi:hypothetical protein